MRQEARLRTKCFGPGTFALLLCIMLLSACSTTQLRSSTANNLGTPKTTKITATPTPTMFTHDQSGFKGRFRPLGLHMLDQAHGWAMNTDTILKTADGGIHWHRVGPANTPLSPTARSVFLNDQIAWISMIKMSVGVVILRTTDGGQHWQTTTIDGMPTIQAGTPQLDFINSQLGWFEVAPNGPSPSGEAVDIYHTSDGGASWNKIASSTDASSGLPDLGFKSGLSFEDAQDGWATGEQFSSTPWLYVTHDGGKTWIQQQLPNLPVSHGRETNVDFYATKPPVFFGHKGLLPVQITGQTNGILLYTTNDSGQSWNTTYPTNQAALGQSAINQDINSFYIGDMQHAWTVHSQTQDDALYGTSDGGQSWHKFAAGMGQSLSFMSFINAEDGWVFDNNGLSKTTDGGQTFQNVHYAYPQ